MTQTEAPIKILFCIDCLVRGGTELQLIGLIERLDPSRYEPYLLTLRPTDPALTPKNCTHLAWDLPKLFSPKGLTALSRLKRWLQREQVAVVQTYFQDSTQFAGLAARLARTPRRIACMRDMGFWSNPKQKWLMRRAYAWMTDYICNAQVVKDHFVRHFRINPERARVIRNGVDVVALPFREHTGPTEHIGIVGNMTRRVKRTDLFIRAAALVAEEYPQITWHIVGEGQLQAELEELASSCGILEKLRFAGRVSDVAGYLEQLQLGVICSDSEGLSNALLEYQFKGTAAVATAVGGNPELIESGVTGLLVPPDDAQALAEALLSLCRDTDYRQRLAKTARERVSAHYNWELCLAEHAELYKQGEP